MNDRDSISICTWNILIGNVFDLSILNYNNRLKQVQKYLENIDSDIICLQEVCTVPLVNELKKNLEHKYDFYYERRDILIAQIINFIILVTLYYIINDSYLILITFLLINLIFKNSSIYAWIFGEIQGGLVTLIKKEKKYDIQFQCNYFNEQQGDLLNIFNKRAYHKIYLKHNTLDTESLIINTHVNSLSNNKIMDGPCQYRDDQLEELYKEGEKFKYFIISGDLNCNIEKYLNKYKLIDNCKDISNNYTWVSENSLTRIYGNIKNENKILDYILSKGYNNLETQIVFKNPPASDHYGIISKLQFDKGEKIKKKNKGNEKEKEKEKEINKD